VYSIWTDELFFAEEGGGAFCGETQQLFASNTTSVDEAIVCTHPVACENFLRILTFCPRLRSLGTFELEACYLARGSVDCVVNFNSSLWSLGAASLIAREAYCTVADLEVDESPSNTVAAQPSFIDIERSVNVVAGNSHLVSRIVGLLRDEGRASQGVVDESSGLDDSERFPQSFDTSPSL
jgi:fructose-1,6-bisphosphatase/inositol monophosphatase family enzyme